MGYIRVKLSSLFIKLRIVSLNGANMRYILFVLMIFGLTGCESYISNNLKNSFLEGKSIVVVPKPIVYDRWTYWSRAGDDTRSRYFYDGYEVGYGFIAIAMDAGIYHLEKVKLADKKSKNIASFGNYSSKIGYITIIKTPEKDTETTYIKKGERVEKTVNIESYYKTDGYVFGDGQIGSFRIEPNEVVLLPSVSVDMDVAEDSCIVINNKEEWFLFQLLDSDKKTLFGKLWDVAGTTNGFETWEWKCPIKSFFITIETKSVSDFLSRVNKKSFPNEMMESIKFRDFEFGTAFENAQKLKTFIHGIEQYEIKSFGAE
jgi:hypothetical protein